MSINYQLLFEQEKQFREQLQSDHQEYKERCAEIEEFLEKEIAELNSKLHKKDEELLTSKNQITSIQNESSRTQVSYSKQIDQLNTKCFNLEESSRNDRMKIITLENENEYLLSQNRALESVNSDMEQRIDSSLEELALLSTELDEERSLHDQNKQTIERLKHELEKTQSELQHVISIKQQLLDQLTLPNDNKCNERKIDSRETSTTQTQSTQGSPKLRFIVSSPFPPLAKQTHFLETNRKQSQQNFKKNNFSDLSRIGSNKSRLQFNGDYDHVFETHNCWDSSINLAGSLIKDNFSDSAETNMLQRGRKPGTQSSSLYDQMPQQFLSSIPTFLQNSKGRKSVSCQPKSVGYKNLLLFNEKEDIDENNTRQVKSSTIIPINQ